MTPDTCLHAWVRDRVYCTKCSLNFLAHIATLDTALAASRAEVESARTLHEQAVNENEGIRDKLRDAERLAEHREEVLRGWTQAFDEVREKYRLAHERAEHAEQRVKGLEAMVERKNAALARPCISCGYTPNVIKPATPPPVAPSGGKG